MTNYIEKYKTQTVVAEDARAVAETAKNKYVKAYMYSLKAEQELMTVIENDFNSFLFEDVSSLMELRDSLQSEEIFNFIEELIRKIEKKHWE